MFSCAFARATSFTITNTHHHEAAQHCHAGAQGVQRKSIASHRWAEDETTYKDVKKRRNTDTGGYQKIEHYCEFLRRTNVKTTREMSVLSIERDCQWLWIDTASIDKQSSADLSECINSMFYYNSHAEVCYAYLHDVGPLQDYHGAIMDFMKSECFRRGWTLQELLAPRTVVFLNREWHIIGHKCQLDTCDLTCQGFGNCLNAKISIITGIPNFVLNNAWKSTASATELCAVEAYMKDRRTERIEDRAYCLLGLLGVNLVPIYGERENAWSRLVDEVEKKIMNSRRRRRRRIQDEGDPSLWFGREDSTEVVIGPKALSETIARLTPPSSRPPYFDDHDEAVRVGLKSRDNRRSTQKASISTGTDTLSTRSSKHTIPSAKPDSADRGRPREMWQGSDKSRRDRGRADKYPIRVQLPRALRGRPPTFSDVQVDVNIDELLSELPGLVTVLEW